MLDVLIKLRSHCVLCWETLWRNIGKQMFLETFIYLCWMLPVLFTLPSDICFETFFDGSFTGCSLFILCFPMFPFVGPLQLAVSGATFVDTCFGTKYKQCEQSTLFTLWRHNVGIQCFRVWTQCERSFMTSIKQ